MKKQYLLTLLLLTATAVANAQTFREHLVNRPISIPISSEIGDVDVDGDKDIVTTSTEGELVWYEQQPDSTFIVHYIETFLGPMEGNDNLAIADLDGDGNVDILTNSGILNSGLSWYRNDGSQSFSPITIASSITNMEAGIVVQDVDNDGDNDIVSTQSNNLIILENDGAENFTETTFLGPGGISQFKLEDFDGDDLLDIAVAGGTGLSVFIQSAGLTFSENVVASTGHNDVEIGDIDGDSDLDLVASTNGDVLVFYYNSGDNSTFTTVTGLSGVAWLHLADMDVDGDLDLVYRPPGFTVLADYRFTILRNDSTPDFNESNLVTVFDDYNRGGQGLEDITVGYFDEDDKPDVLITYSTNGRIDLHRTIDIYGPEQFLRQEVSQSSGDVQDISVADLDGDGFLDVVSSSRTDYEIDWYQNVGDNLEFTPLLVDRSEAISNYVVDLDGDGDMDIVASEEQGSTGTGNNLQRWILWYENDGSESFTRHAIIAGAGVGDVEAADMDNDGDIDIIASITGPLASDEGVRVFYNDGSENFTTYNLPGVSTQISPFCAYDMDNDNLKDVLVWRNGAVSWCKNLNGTFASAVELNLNSTTGIFSSAEAIEVADMDNDNDLDVVFASGSIATVGYMENVGGLSFDRSPIFNSSVYNGGRDLKLADVDDNGYTDIVVGASNGGVVLINNDAGTFTFNSLLDASEGAYSNITTVQVVDFDTDGDLDIVYGGTSGDRIAWLEQCVATTSTAVVSACETYTWIDGNTYTQSNNTATWVIDNAAGCDSIITLNLTISEPEPTVQETMSVCEGDSYTFPDGTTQVITSQVVYTSTIPSVATACDSVIETTVNVTAVENGATDAGGTLTATAVGATYQWVDCNNGNTQVDGETNQSFTPTVSGSYAVEVTENGCTDISDCFTVVITDLTDLDMDGKSVYPNPTNGQFTITGVAGDYSVEVYNNMGQLLLRQDAVQANTTLNLQEQAAGIYHVHVIANDKVSRFKLVKQ